MLSQPLARGPWAHLTWLVRLFWACRVSLVSALAGVALFRGAVPAQNLMADLSYWGSPYEVVHWGLVFVFTFLMWAFPAHYAARVALRERDWMLAAADRRSLGRDECEALENAIEQRFRCCIKWAPRLIGLVPFAALGIGIWYGARADIGAVALPAGSATIAQARWLGGADLVTALAFLAFVIFRCSLVERLEFWGNRVDWLRIVTIVAWAVTSAYFALSYFAPILTSVWTPRALLVPPLFGCSVLALGWLARLGHRTGAPTVAALALAAVALTALNRHFNDLRVLPVSVPTDGRLRIAEAAEAWRAANGCGPRPSTVAPVPASCPRPIVIAIDGGASRAAFAAATFLGELLDRMPAPGAAEATTPGRRVFAISGVSGGAFGAATIQAALADAQTADSRAAVRTPCRRVDPTWFRASDWSGDTFTWRECLQALTSGDYLSPTIIGLAFRDAFAPPFLPSFLSIQDRATLLEQSFERHYDATVRREPGFLYGGETCGPEAGTTGFCRAMAHPKDFLAAHAGGWMPLLMLNATSVRTGRRVVSADLASSPSRADVNGSLYNEAFDLHEAMAERCPGVPDPRPLGTRYADDVTADASGDGTTIRTRTSGTCATPLPASSPDVRLSTAALTSARFPLISPAGGFTMHDSANPSFGDEVVDGGYFENSGITTALDVVATLREQKLDPILVSVGNDPEADLVVAGLPRRPSATPLETTPDDGFWARAFAFLKAPIDTLLATRDGHAAEALHDAQAYFPQGGYYRFRVEQVPLLDEDQPDPGCRAIIDAVRRSGQKLSMTNVSMSWWLSAAVQADLDAQRCAKGNRQVLAAVLADVAPPKVAPSDLAPSRP